MYDKVERPDARACVRAVARVRKDIGHLRALAAQRTRGQYTFIFGVSRMRNAQPTHDIWGVWAVGMGMEKWERMAGPSRREIETAHGIVTSGFLASTCIASMSEMRLPRPPVGGQAWEPVQVEAS